MLLTNPAVISIFVMVVLCLLRVNVLLSIVFSTLIAGLSSDMGLVQTINLMIKGMSGNMSIALSYIFLGILAVAISTGNLTKVLAYRVSLLVENKKILFVFLIAFLACFAENLIPIHIAFIPILIPPLLGLMNTLKIDRRAVACALAFGLEAPYICIPVGFGLIYQTIIQEQMLQNGIEVSIFDIASVMWIGGLAMLFGLIFAVLILYRKPREYNGELLDQKFIQLKEVKLQKDDYVALLGAAIAFSAQIITSSLPLGAFIGIIFMIATGVIKWEKMDKVVDDGIKSMALIAFIMLIASGFAEVLKESGGVQQLVEVTANVVGGKLGGIILMLLVGLLVTMGIGTSFGTIPVIATFYCPLCIELGFGVSAIILLLGIAGALGDAGSPASDTTIGPTMGLNIDGQHNHIWDTCVPTFLVYNISLLIFGIIGAFILG
ncbi:TRAP transporter large permease subunit [Helicobacter sp. faydin-H20]|uniref:Na+/H+ antiporter family protein n=1 Tax=Helicobacter anatolicus TaxID=2905874 RepID=UPI001E4EE9B1|nr:Na+/H+ antiporter NhaC family protein [Helicobacter anatolicus]MCE3036339.1 TRAP transporter large permease subunit [Helicobacter anatolicus]